MNTKLFLTPLYKLRGVKLTIKDAQLLAHSNGGECLGKEYLNCMAPMKWICKNGHTWLARLCSVKGGSWCRFCSDPRRLTVKAAQKVASDKGGRCLTSEYISTASPMFWECEKGHRWSARLDNIKYSGTWCPFCSKTAPVGLDDYKKLAAKAHYSLVGSIAKTTMEKTKWRCENNHYCKISYDAMRAGKRCRECRGYIQEKRVRCAMEQLLSIHLPSTRPDWLRYKSGRNLELDGYNKQKKIAFEYQGEQHARENFLSEGQRFQSLIERDVFKRIKCAEVGVKLFIIWYNLDIEKQIRDQAQEYALPVKNTAVDFTKANICENKLESLRKLLPDWIFPRQPYPGARGKVKCFCPSGHLRYSTPDNLKRGHRCRECNK